MFKKNFFKYILEKTFHYTQRAGTIHLGFAWFFVVTAVLNELVRSSMRLARFITCLASRWTGSTSGSCSRSR
jgi:intracellular septation protein A